MLSLVNFARKYSTHGALDGVKILDLTRIVAGPYCTMILGDLGATVYKVESPTGDDCRKWPPYLGDGQSGMTCYFACVNRNKKSISVDMKSPKGLDLILGLAKKCDVLIENFVPGKLEKLGLGYEQIKAIVPSIIYCSVTGFGRVGPYADRGGYDNIAAAMGGLFHITGPKDGDPCKVGVAMTDIATGLYAHGAILAALYHRQLTGQGQKIDCDLFSTQLSCLINLGGNYLNAGKEANRSGTQHASIVIYQALATADGYVSVGTGNDSHFREFCRRFNREDLLRDERFSTNPSRVKHRDALIATIEPEFRTRTTEQILSLLEGVSFPYGPVNNMQQVFNDPHLKAIGLVKEVQSPTNGTIKMVGPPVAYSLSENRVRSPPPELGQHTKEILANELNYSDSDIDMLYKEKVVF